MKPLYPNLNPIHPKARLCCSSTSCLHSKANLENRRCVGVGKSFLNEQGFLLSRVATRANLMKGLL